MSADTQDLSKVDSAISGLSSSPKDEKTAAKKRTSSSAAGVMNVNDLGQHYLLLITASFEASGDLIYGNAHPQIVYRKGRD